MITNLIRQSIWNPFEAQCENTSFNTIWISDPWNFNNFGSTKFGTFHIRDCKHTDSLIQRVDVCKPLGVSLIIGIKHN